MRGLIYYALINDCGKSDMIYKLSLKEFFMMMTTNLQH